jgi:hypothetical protein
MAYQDGTFTAAKQDGAYRPWFPFANSPTKDTNTEGSIYSYVMLAANYAPAAANTTAPHANTQYLVNESELNVEGGIARFTRTFCEVPEDQVWYESRVITKPTAASTGAAIQSYISEANTVAWLGNGYQVNDYIFSPTNEIYSPPITATSSNSGSDTSVVCTSPHGLAGTEDLLVRWATVAPTYPAYMTVRSGEYTVVNTTAITVTGYTLGAAATQIAVFFRDYTPGTDRVGVQLTQSFYLPGVTANINTAADIPIPSLLLNDLDFLTTLTSGATGYANYDATELTQWMGPIYTQTFIKIDLDDV